MQGGGMGWINVLSFSLWIYGEEIFKRDLKQEKKATGNMALFKIIAETFLQGKDGVSISQKLQQIPLPLSSKGLMAS